MGTIKGIGFASRRKPPRTQDQQAHERDAIRLCMKTNRHGVPTVPAICGFWSFPDRRCTNYR